MDVNKNSVEFRGPGTVQKTFILLLCILFSFIIYLPVVNRQFVSDDFKILDRVCRQHIFFIKGFFRPLSDITIYLNFKIGGLNPGVFNSFGILIHGINCFLLYIFCQHFSANASPRNKNPFSILSSLLFLCYPFHNEAIVWLLGRGASIACMFALLSLIAFYQVKPIQLKRILTGICYFFSLAAYESTLLFPLIFILLLIYENHSAKSIRTWGFVLFMTLLTHIFVRFWISGSLTGSYGEDFLQMKAMGYLFNILRVAVRLALPPIKNVLLPAAVILVVFIGISIVIYHNLRRTGQFVVGRTTRFLLGSLIVSCIIPFLTGVSIQTSESDRMLYFPSVFVCLIVAYLIIYKMKNNWLQWFSTISLFIYFLFFLEINNSHWKKASELTSYVLGKMNDVTRSDKKDRIFFLNIPEELEGAYVFRQGFSSALKLYGYDSSRFAVVNYLSRKESENPKNSAIAAVSDTIVVSSRVKLIKLKEPGCNQIFVDGQNKYSLHPDDHIYYWNSKSFDSLNACW